jgi:predicted ATP-grasp superfamily ATP-dependent carboligase
MSTNLLFSYDEGIDQRTIHDRVLLITLGAYADAGGVQRQLDEHLRNNLAGREIGRFDTDQVIDYRDNRPIIDFAGDRYANYREPAMVLREFTDKAGEPFLLLSGPEPSLQWEKVAATINRIVDELDVELVVTAQGMPMPVPHTRPVGMFNFATDPKLLLIDQPSGHFQMSSSFTGLLAVRMEQADNHLLGLLAHVPQYLSDTDYPQAVIAMIDALNKATGLKLPLGALPAAATFVRGQIDAQLRQSDELSEMVRGLEQRYDAYQERRAVAAEAQANLPGGDEIAAEAEAFLASLDKRGDRETGTPTDKSRPADDSPAGPGESAGPAAAEGHDGSKDDMPDAGDPDLPGQGPDRTNPPDDTNHPGGPADQH